MPLKTHEFLKRERDCIISAWEQAIRMEPRLVSLEGSALRNELPEFIDDLAAWMEREEEPGRGSLGSLPAAHAAQRNVNGYQLAQLVEEYRVLRTTILRLLLHQETAEQMASGASGMERRVSDLARLNAGLDRAISEAVEYFVGERERARERFIGILGHDLRSPLNTIMSSAHLMLRSGKLPPGLDQPAGRIARNAELMTRMVGDLLDLVRARIGEGLPITTGPVDMGEVCRTTIEDMRVADPSRAVTIEVDGDLWGEWDRDRAIQAIGNLVSNALKYGRDPVVVSATGAADEVLVAVTNHGETIPQDLVSKLFDPFQRGELGAGRRAGVGLGLFIVKEIMRAHGGTVALESAEEGGTTFTLRWPRNAQRRAPAPPA